MGTLLSKSILHGQSVLVTGASSGMGAAVAKLVAARGANVCCMGRDPERTESIVAAINASGARASAFVGDVSQSQMADAAVAATCAAFGEITGAVNAAGVIFRGDALATDDDTWIRLMSTNVNGSFYICRATVRAMRGAGSIVNFGSSVGLVGTKGMPAYCASKGAVVQLTRAMALDHAQAQIRFNAVCPGAVDTPMLVSGHHAAITSTEVLENNADEIPQRRVPDAVEVAELVAFLLSDASRHITGTAIPIDGGYTAQ